MNQTFDRYFSPEEAAATLPLVKKIVNDILQSAGKTNQLKDSGNYLNIEKAELVKQINAEVQSFIDELSELGCFYKYWNFNIGLVDFPSIINGKEVFLCWKSDEETIHFYHEIEKGFAGRMVIPAQYL